MSGFLKMELMRYWPIFAVLITYAIAGISGYASMSAEIKQLQEFRLETKVTLKEMAGDVSEIKSDIKLLLRQGQK